MNYNQQHKQVLKQLKDARRAQQCIYNFFKKNKATNIHSYYYEESFFIDVDVPSGIYVFTTVDFTQEGVLLRCYYSSDPKADENTEAELAMEESVADLKTFLDNLKNYLN